MYNVHLSVLSTNHAHVHRVRQPANVYMRSTRKPVRFSSTSVINFIQNPNHFNSRKDLHSEKIIPRRNKHG